MNDLLNTLSQELQNELKDFGTTFVGVYENELHTISDYELTYELIEKLESTLLK